MALFASEPARELVDAGLHRLAQPLTAALWIAEAAEEQPLPRGIAATDATSVPKITHELRRAVGVLRALHSVLENAAAARPGADAVAVLAEMPHWAALCAAAGVSFTSANMHADLHADLCAAMPPEALHESLLHCWRALLLHAHSGMRAEVSTASNGVLYFRLLLSDGERLSKAEQLAFTGPFDPFETPGYNFVHFVPPREFLARTALAEVGIGLHASATDTSLQLELRFPSNRRM